MKKYAISEAIGQVIRQYRTNAGLTTKQLAHRIGISQQQLSRYERGVTVLMWIRCCVSVWPLNSHRVVSLRK
ncbi:helix-turn-helix domain-containing protein [Morganella morganii]|uniref:helix-turn-helix domain-containing protein n=1 Tax=Morganella morganii TaxID=582 RepID=UPI003EBF5452